MELNNPPGTEMLYNCRGGNFGPYPGINSVCSSAWYETDASAADTGVSDHSGGGVTIKRWHTRYKTGYESVFNPGHFEYQIAQSFQWSSATAPGEFTIPEWDVTPGSSPQVIPNPIAQPHPATHPNISDRGNKDPRNKPEGGKASDGLETQPTYNFGTDGKTVQPPPVVREPPKKGEKEKKAATFGGAARLLQKWFHRATETGDLVDALIEALEGEPCKKVSGLHNKMSCLAKNWDKLDLAEALKNVVTNEIEDRIIGRLQRAAAEAGRNVNKGLGKGDHPVNPFKGITGRL